MEVMGYLLALVVGISLGLFGGGGSIFTVPILVYIFNFNLQISTTYSLFVVGVSSLVGAVKHYRLNNLRLQPALQFGLPSIISLIITRQYLLPKIPNNINYFNNAIISKNTLLMLLLAIIMIGVAITIIYKRHKVVENFNQNVGKLITVGLLVGVITGVLGAGGGFLIIPSLLFFANLKMLEAIGTSLLIISINAIIGFTADLCNTQAIDVQFLFLFTCIAILGITIGTYLSKKINGNTLKPFFGIFMLLSGIYIIVKELVLK